MDIRTKGIKIEIADVSKDELLDLYNILNTLEDRQEQIGHAVEFRKAIDDWADFFDVDLEKAKRRQL